jgi:hypothetical protein
MVFAVVAPDEVVATNGSKEYCVCTVPDASANASVVCCASTRSVRSPLRVRARERLVDAEAG